MLPILIERFLELVRAPFDYPDMLWIIIPLLLTLFLMELYFGRYKFEELGWNTAFGNSLVLIFVSMDLLRRLYTQNMLAYLNLRAVLAIAVIFEGVFLVLIGFFHLLPKKLAFGVSAKLPINFIAYISVILVYSTIPIDFITLFASIIFLIGFAALIRGMQILMPGVVEEEEVVEEKEEIEEKTGEETPEPGKSEFE